MHLRSLCWLCSSADIASDNLMPFQASRFLGLSIFLNICPLVVVVAKVTLMDQGLDMPIRTGPRR